MTATPPLQRLFIAALLLGAVGPALALYKVVGPDGSVTYTDRPPAAANSKITSLGRNGESAVVDAGLPFDLRQVAAKYPVTLYTSVDCSPCDSGRQFLQQRGVPFNEKRIVSEDDAAALERTVGGRTLPALTVGSQALRGLSQGDWTSFLDAAGYPRESKLPRGYQAPAATPLVERAPPPQRAPVAPAPPPPAVPEPAADAPSVKF
jgi:glutaredoxin